MGVKARDCNVERRSPNDGRVYSCGRSCTADRSQWASVLGSFGKMALQHSRSTQHAFTHRVMALLRQASNWRCKELSEPSLGVFQGQAAASEGGLILLERSLASFEELSWPAEKKHQCFSNDTIMIHSKHKKFRMHATPTTCASSFSKVPYLQGRR